MGWKGSVSELRTPKNRLSNRQAYRKKPNQGSLDTLRRLDQYPVENEWLRLNPSRHSSLGQACEGLTVIGQDSTWMPKCWIMWVDVSPSTWLFRWHPTARNALYYEVCELFGWTCTENNGRWLASEVQIGITCLTTNVVQSIPICWQLNNPHHPDRPDDWHGP